MAERVQLVNSAPVFVSPDPRRTSEYYRDVFGFELVEHYEAAEAFVALYRDGVEIIVVQAKHGEVESNTTRYGAGFDVYLDPENVEGVDTLYAELKERGAQIVKQPTVTPYGCYEFVVEDIDGRLVGIGRIRDQGVFFKGARG